MVSQDIFDARILLGLMSCYGLSIASLGLMLCYGLSIASLCIIVCALIAI